MPKAPILNRETFYDRLGDGTFRDLDWNLVNTELGAMVEPRTLMSGLAGARGIVHTDLKDISFNKRSELDEDAFYRLMGTGGRQIPVDFNA